MKRIMVVGVSAGAGKSTFARELGETLKLPVYHLDRYYWKPNWIEASPEEFSLAQEEIVHEDQWIIEGNYSTTFSIRSKEADTIFYIELPLYICLYRVVKRWITNIGQNRVDMGEGCIEKLDWKFIKFIITTYFPRKKQMPDRIQACQTEDMRKTIYVFKNTRDIHKFLKKIKKDKTMIRSQENKSVTS